MKILEQGAEAVVYLDENNIIKERLPKKYSLQAIDDKLRKQNTRREVKLLNAASNYINAPKVIDSDDAEMKIKMEFINGSKLRDIFDGLKDRNKVCVLLGRDIAKLHDNNIIHGDLTTSNIMMKGGKIYFIDFGLGFISHKIEDKAVDLHVLHQALGSKHYKFKNESFNAVLDGYKSSKNCKEVLDRLKKVEGRGRYK